MSQQVYIQVRASFDLYHLVNQIFASNAFQLSRYTRYVFFPRTNSQSYMHQIITHAAKIPPKPQPTSEYAVNRYIIHTGNIKNTYSNDIGIAPWNLIAAAEKVAN